MAASGSILGHPVVRLEDPTLLTGEAKYVDDLRCPAWPRRVRALARRPRHDHVDRRQRGRGRCPACVAVYRAGRRRPRPGAVPGLPDDAGRRSTGRSSPRTRVRFVGDIVAAVVAETEAQAVDAAEAVVVDYDPLPAVDHRRRRRWRPTPRSCSPSTARTSASPPTFGDDVDAARGRRRGRRGHDGEPAPGRRADGVQRHRRRARRARRRPHAAGCRTRRRTPPTPRMAPALGLEPEQLRVVCPWVGGGFGPKAAVYVEYLVAAAAALRARPAGEVDRDPLGGHGLARPRPRLRDDGQARR